MIYLFEKFKGLTGLGPFSRRLKAWVVDQPRPIKRWIVMGIDLVVLLFVMAGLVYGRIFMVAGFETPAVRSLLFLSALPLLSVVSFRFLGLYRLVTRHVGNKGLIRIGYSLLAAIMLWSLVLFLADWRGSLSILPRSVIIAYFFLGWLAIFTLRDLTHWWLRDKPLELLKTLKKDNRKVLIYGAGEAGLALLKMLKESGHFKVMGFLDDDPSLWSMKLNGYKVHRFENLDQLIKEEMIAEVFVSIPSLSRLQRRKIIRKLEPWPVRVRILPRISEIASGRVQASDLKNVDIGDLLGRDLVPPVKKLMQRNITGKSVMITGAGGSIGSELVRQVVALNPARIVLFELSEHALYKIIIELDEKIAALRKFQASLPHGVFEPAIISVLGSIDDEKLVRKTLRAHKVDTVYHAAAYKHIPILEENISAALSNNTLATATLARLVCECAVERMVLISSDKAVRPANVKGATNRLQEIILQAMARDKDCQTIFTAVRFGNVLDSSGSVVPRFHEQIKMGGPVTITHPKIIRYFMSIPEAAELVIQAGAMADNGELYVLDMGEPVKIDDLARTMIRLSGLEVADEDNPHGDIELKYIGLRPGDKMHEELLIEGDVVGTRHPFILRLNEPAVLSPKESMKMIELVAAAVEKDDIGEMQSLLLHYVEGYLQISHETIDKEIMSKKHSGIVAFPTSARNS